MYKLITDGVKRLSDKAFIPADPKNKDWRKYQIWLQDENVPESKDAEPINSYHIPPEIREELKKLKDRLDKLEKK